jgi:hypothetical protein
MTAEELIPFAQSLGVRGRRDGELGAPLELTLTQSRLLRGLFADRPPAGDRWKLELEHRAQARRWARIRGVAVALLQGLDLDLRADGVASGDLRRFLQDVRDELELIARVLELDAQPALERLASIALKATR